MARTSTFNNWGKTYRSMSYHLLDAGKQLTEISKRDFTYLAQEYLSEVDAKWPHTSYGRVYHGLRGGVYKVLNGAQFGGDATHPWYYGQLHDSVAVRIADKNRTVSVSYMPTRATTPQHTSKSDGVGEYKNIIGAEWAQIAAYNAQYYFLPGIQFQLIIGVPYAQKVNESGRHHAFADRLMDDLVVKIEDYMWSQEFRNKCKKVKFSGSTAYGRQFKKS